ncbi:cold-responsive protein kinase 1-like [Mangifera indica]|uniref:cold-responsive protein kinase 1-like n=1 Tax=Mangifera indica TaxID=29780 RepID=UPI001CF98E63|nr:cold-responsive protein kinase 1-like [Mangifera indica]XP_044472778.1 cold-responsive protein kinase 1-like [Mangifera indica]XP_044479211.1 cold-responsive protein kinase 1-like [Mangifera indica]XP_044479212.1 cold-responsive protein kinase 1-like [Mangifera indica]
MTCFLSFFRKKRVPFGKNALKEEVSNIHDTKMYTYGELRKATENFSVANKIGQGGFGSVYKGRLQDGTLAAIKVLSAESRQGEREFLREIEAIARIKHENLVKLHGCCVEGNYRILVYGYLENNSLAQTLLGRGHSSIQFSWHTRRNICIGVAQGLAFLHEEVHPHIVHRDIKASNILLDKDLTPKISDFGLAKFFPSDMTHISTRVAGTEGYLAPEYAMRGQLTRKADIYSFGVLLLEIVSGRCNTNKRLPYEEQYLLERAWQLYEKGELLKLVDALLNEDYNVEEADRYLKIALICTQDMAKLRPSMSTVVQMLAGEIDLSKQEISKPGLLSELLGLKVGKGQKDESDDSGKLDGSSSMLRNMDTSYATMTFNSIYDRSS